MVRPGALARSRHGDRELFIDLRRHFVQLVQPFPPRPASCLSCPPLERMEMAVLGGMVLNTIDDAAARGLDDLEQLRRSSTEYADKLFARRR